MLAIDGEEVSIEEVQLYLDLTKKAFEKTGGEEVWSISLAGRDPEQTAVDTAMESLIRTKILSRQVPASDLTEEDRQAIRQSTNALFTSLHKEKIQCDLTKQQLFRCMEESYRAWLYRKSMVFLPGSQEEELEYQVAERFMRYDTIDEPTYLQRIELDAIMIYTGQWIDDRWVEYPQAQLKEKQTRIEEAKKLLETGSAFEDVGKVYSEDSSLQENLLLHEGAIQADTETTPVLYRGQIQTDLADILFRTPAGEYTDIISTQYGYIIVYVKNYSDAEPEDYEIFRQQLAQAKEQYRVSLLQELSEVQFESEYERLKTEVEVVINEELWDIIMN